MNNFSFEIASDINKAIERIGATGVRPIGGGTNILDLMKEDVLSPDVLVDLNQLDFKDIHWEEDSLAIGALVTNSDLAYHPLIEEHFPLLSQAILAGASPQIRNMATTGGNILQRTRCYYFYDVGTPCNKREPGSGCGALHGRNRIHAILGQTDQCIAVHPSDMCVALSALDAKVRVKGKAGTREIEFQDFHRLPGSTPHLDNNLRPDEIITHVIIPRKAYANYTYFKVRDRASYSFALFSVAALLQIEDGLIKEASVALGGVAHKPWRDKKDEMTLIGRPATDETFETFARHILRAARGYQDNAFKIELGRKAIVKAMREASQRTVQ